MIMLCHLLDEAPDSEKDFDSDFVSAFANVTLSKYNISNSLMHNVITE